jgi:hypothetical protein
MDAFTIMLKLSYSYKLSNIYQVKDRRRSRLISYMGQNKAGYSEKHEVIKFVTVHKIDRLLTIEVLQTIRW